VRRTAPSKPIGDERVDVEMKGRKLTSTFVMRELTEADQERHARFNTSRRVSISVDARGI